MIRIDCDSCWTNLTNSTPDTEYKSYRLYGNNDTNRFITSFHFCSKCLAEKEMFHVSIKNQDYKTSGN